MLDTKASTQKQIEDLEHERNGLVFRRTTKAAVDAAKLLSGAATKAREQECGKVGDNCRKRQDAQATALAALTKAQENKATTDRFDEIETELKRLRSNLEVYARSRTRSQPLAPPVNATSHKPRLS